MSEKGENLNVTRAQRSYPQGKRNRIQAANEESNTAEVSVPQEIHKEQCQDVFFFFK